MILLMSERFEKKFRRVVFPLTIQGHGRENTTVVGKVNHKINGKMGKNQHSKDRLFITATEWSQQYGGKKRRANGSEIRPLPFDHCALSLTPFTTPAMLNNNSGVIFEYENILEYVQKYRSDPVSGDPVTGRDIIQLHMVKNTDGEWNW